MLIQLCQPSTSTGLLETTIAPIHRELPIIECPSRMEGDYWGFDIYSVPIESDIVPQGSVAVTVGVIGNPIRADSILRRENDPSLVQVFYTTCLDDVRFLNTSRTFYIIQNYGTHGSRPPDDLRLSPLWELSSRNGCVNQKRATRNKARKFVIKDGVLHYIYPRNISNGCKKIIRLSEEGNADIPTDPDSPTSPESLSSYRHRQVLGLVPHGVCRT